MNVLLTGGTGWIGGVLTAALRAEGHAVRVLSRSDRLQGWDDGVELVPWDQASASIPEAALRDVDAVVNLAGASIGGGRWTKARKQVLFASRVETTYRLVEAIAHSETKPSVMISMSAVGYYGARGDEVITEAVPPGPDFLSVVCSHWEDAAKKVIPSGVRLVILRTGVVFGPGAEALRRMALPFRFFVGGPIGSGKQVLSWVHLDDVIGVMRYALTQTHVSGPLNLTAPQAVTNKEFSRALGRALKRPSLFPVPAFVLRLMLGEMSQIALTGQRAVPKRLLEYGYEFRYTDVEAALRASL